MIGQGCNGYPEILAAAEKRHNRGDRAGADEAMADVWAALRVTDGLDSSVALKQYFALHGFAIPPYDRSGTPPYGADTVKRVGEGLDRLRAGYRAELGLKPFGRLGASN